MSRSNNPIFIAVASGKGGVGKSTISSNLGISFAKAGIRTIILDADFGGANVHSIFNVGKPARTLSEFLDKEILTLQDVVISSGRKNLDLICGVRSAFNMANFPHAQKLKLFRHLPKLDADVVILDIGAGTSYHVLDLFLYADQKIVVTIPTKPALENAYQLIRSAIVRDINIRLKNMKAEKLLTADRQKRLAKGIITVKDLLQEIYVENQAAGSVLREQLESMDMSLLVNRIQIRNDYRLGPSVVVAFKKYFGWNIQHIGDLIVDRNVEISEKKMQIITEVDVEGNSAFVKSFEQMSKFLRKKTIAEVNTLSF